MTAAGPPAPRRAGPGGGDTLPVHAPATVDTVLVPAPIQPNRRNLAARKHLPRPAMNPGRSSGTTRLRVIDLRLCQELLGKAASSPWVLGM